jgi:phage tail sheath protein FI
MPQYLSPGVYVEEVPSSSAPIAGVGTSTAGFIGEVATSVTMPGQPGKFDAQGDPVPYPVAAAGQPQLITSWLAFKNNFGDIQAGNTTLAHAVYGFFNNGGTRCWVTRVNDVDSATEVGAALSDFAAIDEIALVAAPGALNIAVQGAILDHCENTGDRFAIIDGHRTATLTPAAIKGGDPAATPAVAPLRNSNYGAIYFPWIAVFDPATNATIFQPPSGHVAGVYSRVDTVRGVHKAPANEVIRGSVGVEALLSKADHDGLNPAGINVIRSFDGAATIWGARTIGGDANGEWKYVPVRRLFLFLRESIDEGTRWVVFEPNDRALWAKITRNVTAFLTNVWRSGALFGSTPAEAFYVKCDDETNPPDVRDLGQVVTEIGVAVVKPAEFVIFRISQWAGPGQ